MSRKRRRRRNTIAAPAVATKASPPLVVRLAESDLDAAAIHGFLCTVAPRSGALQCEVNPEKSMREVWRVVRALDQAQPGETPYGFALTALIGDKLVGTLGVICPDWWYGDGKFFTDRWFFTLPGVAGVGAALTADADALAWMSEQAGADPTATEGSTAKAMVVPEGAINFNMGTLVGSYAAVAAMLDEAARVPGTKGIMLTFDDFLIGMEQFGQRIQPLMATRRARLAETA